MSVILPFVTNAGLNFVLGLLVARFLGPAEFGRYAIGAAIIVLVNTALLDWLRLSAVRFYSQAAREERPEVRATLDLLVTAISVALCAGLVLALALGFDFGLPAMLLGAAVLAGVGAGLFDYHGAVARALYLDGAYTRLIVVKNVMALLLMVGGAWATRDPATVLLGGLASTAIALIAVRRAVADRPLSLSGARRSLARDFMLYALPLVGGNAIYALMPLINRSFLANAHGFAEAGYFSLASDIGMKLFGALGSALEIVLLRQVIGLDEEQGREAALRRIAANFGVVLMVTLPVAVGLFAVLPAFDRLLVPPSFQGRFTLYMSILLPGFAGITLFVAGLYPVFLLGKRTGIAILAALFGLAVNLGWIVFAAGGQPTDYAVAQSVAFVAVLVVTAIAAFRSLPAGPNWRDLLAVLAAAALMAGCLWPLRGRFAALPELLLQIGLGAAIYIAAMLAGDVAGCRSALRRWREGRKAAA